MYSDFSRERHITLYTVFLCGYWRLDTLVIIILLLIPSHTLRRMREYADINAQFELHGLYLHVASFLQQHHWKYSVSLSAVMHTIASLGSTQHMAERIIVNPFFQRLYLYLLYSLISQVNIPFLSS